MDNLGLNTGSILSGDVQLRQQQCTSLGSDASRLELGFGVVEHSDQGDGLAIRAAKREIWATL